MRPELLEPKGELNPELLSDVLLLVGVEAPLEAIGQWTKLEMILVYDWAIREHVHASGGQFRRRSRPSLVLAKWSG